VRFGIGFERKGSDPQCPPIRSRRVAPDEAIVEPLNAREHDVWDLGVEPSHPPGVVREASSAFRVKTNVVAIRHVASGVPWGERRAPLSSPHDVSLDEKRSRVTAESIEPEILFHKTGTTWLQRRVFMPQQGFQQAMGHQEVRDLITGPSRFDFNPGPARSFLTQSQQPDTQVATSQLVVSSERLYGNPFSGNRVLRVSGLDCGEQGPVGFAGVEQATDAVVSEVDEAECDALDSFGEVVDALGRPVRHV
jgi:hypothetical protein